MNAETPRLLPSDQCTDQAFRLAVYEAGHALTARALGLNIVSLRMLPRPPVLVSDKTFVGNDFGSLVATLENRIIELFGGQMAEVLACSSHTCCSGDVARIDELTRLVAGLQGIADPEQIYFELEDVAEKIFAEDRFRDAVIPVAEFLHGQVQNGLEIIQGPELEAELDRHVPAMPKETWAARLNPFGRGNK